MIKEARHYISPIILKSANSDSIVSNSKASLARQIANDIVENKKYFMDVDTEEGGKLITIRFHVLTDQELREICDNAARNGHWFF